jgi:hypothetical protein
MKIPMRPLRDVLLQLGDEHLLACASTRFRIVQSAARVLWKDVHLKVDMLIAQFSFMSALPFWRHGSTPGLFREPHGPSRSRM